MRTFTESTAYPVRVIAGVDGSPNSAAALAWAAADARLRGGELVVVTACGRDMPGIPGTAPPTPAAAEKACRDIQAQLLQALPAEAAPPVTTQVLHGDPVQVLTRTATEQDMLVVGTRGRSRLRTLLLGSVAQGCAERAACPVVVVPSPPRAAAAQPPAHGPVVAGVGSSAEARTALRFAAAEAILRKIPLIPVHAVYPDYASTQTGPGRGTADNDDLLPPLDRARAQLDILIRSELAGTSLTARPIAVYGDPERVLLTWTESAALVVVGTRGTGRIHAALLGSVSTYLLQHGHCPIAVVPTPPSLGITP